LKEKIKILVLYEELANYILSCLIKLNEMYEFEIHVFRKRLNEIAPFDFDFKNLKVYDREDYEYEKLIEIVNYINPSVILCGGWAYKPYLKLVGIYKNKALTILSFDNKWIGSPKQHLAVFYSYFFLLSKFDYCFVPGRQQEIFAKKLGFKKEKILLGFYSCDFDFFNFQFIENLQNKTNHFPKRLIYVGRYLEFKGIKELWQAFIELQLEAENDWELWCLGSGPIPPIKHDKIKHFGFIQPNDLKAFISKTGVFILPSHYEPWGVVVHEFAAAGFPLICSNMVGANEAFLEDNVNGFIFESGNAESLKDKLRLIMNMNDKELNAMGYLSAEKARKINPTIWADKLYTLVSENIKI